MKACIGIVSWLPDEVVLRKKRINKLCKLLSQCKTIFENIPIVIICQNWKEFNPSGVIKFKYNNKLGITGARKELRKKFINSNFDYLIMLDDDCSLTGTAEDGKLYLKQIEENPDCFIEFNTSLLKLFAISKSVFKELDFDDVNPEDGDGFEDRIFVGKLEKLFSDKKRYFNHHGLSEHSISTKDEDSTWYTNQNLNEMVRKTNDIINQK